MKCQEVELAYFDFTVYLPDVVVDLVSAFPAPDRRRNVRAFSNAVWTTLTTVWLIWILLLLGASQLKRISPCRAHLVL